MNDEIKRCFEILELDLGGTIQDAKQARNVMAKVWHPDRFPNDPKLQHRGQEKLKEINSAYELLRDYLADPSNREPKDNSETSQARSQTPKPPSQPFAQPEPNPPTTEENSSVFLEMTCHNCQGNLRFPEEMERATVPCPLCKKELFLWRKSPKANGSHGRDHRSNTFNQENQVASQTPRKPSVFTMITCREDALHIVKRYAGIYYICCAFWIADSLAGNSIDFIYAAVSALFGFLLWKFNSRTIAIISLFANTCAFVINCLGFSQQEIWTPAIAFSILLLSILFINIRAIEATFKIHGIYADS